MVTRLDKELRREVEVDGTAYVVTLSLDGLKIVVKGRRKGLELSWKDLVSGDAALATALNASVAKGSLARP
jgi:hypothetical protein